MTAVCAHWKRGKELEVAVKAIFVLIKGLEKKHGLASGSLPAGLWQWAGSAGNRFSSKAEEMMLDLLNGQGTREERREVFVQTAKSAGGE